MIRQLNNTFVLDTPNTTYIFTVLPSGHLEHLYYGKRIHVTCEEDILPLTEKRVCLAGNAVQYSQEYPTLGLEDVCLEMSSHGKGDIREPFIEVTHHDGSYTSDFLFENAEIKEALSPNGRGNSKNNRGQKAPGQKKCSSRSARASSIFAVSLSQGFHSIRRSPSAHTAILPRKRSPCSDLGQRSRHPLI